MQKERMKKSTQNLIIAIINLVTKPSRTQNIMKEDFRGGFSYLKC